ncbi:hypothetical protein GGS23DRAFT_539052 [Durotheca rogersii]|uniref:uncharacterized protein n=1 Tax=Durotheca rogersii TaxID=419775 RepID=UPI002220D8E9|nr:uncharacterized protein GGS23DRAFT_539052 [Durotheca rogersii]KAI5863541.1 hypothetical protein GGS23DRAFT_539052 [Durotheca rogersii]
MCWSKCLTTCLCIYPFILSLFIYFLFLLNFSSSSLYHLKFFFRLFVFFSFSIFIDTPRLSCLILVTAHFVMRMVFRVRMNFTRRMALAVKCTRGMVVSRLRDSLQALFRSRGDLILVRLKPLQTRLARGEGSVTSYLSSPQMRIPTRMHHQSSGSVIGR